MSTEANFALLPYWAPHLCREPNWRYSHTQRLGADGRCLSRHRDDPDSITAVPYLRAPKDGSSHQDRTQLTHDCPSLPAAQQLAQSKESLLWEIQPRLPVGQSDDAIARCCGPALDTICGYAAQFFTVREWPRARDWVAALAIGLGLRHDFRPDEKGKVRQALAYFGGILTLEVVRAVTGAPPSLSGCALPEGKIPEARLRFPVRLAVAAPRGTGSWIGPSTVLTARRQAPGLGTPRWKRCETYSQVLPADGSRVAIRAMNRGRSRASATPRQNRTPDHAANLISPTQGGPHGREKVWVP